MFLESVATAVAPEPFGHYAQATVTPDGAIWVSVDAVFAAVFGDHRPARAVLQVAGLHHGFRVAADAVAWRIHSR